MATWDVLRGNLYPKARLGEDCRHCADEWKTPVHQNRASLPERAARGMGNGDKKTM
jgi:hypothetical protein